MSNDAEITKVADDDPLRCQAVNSQGQCHNKAVEGGTHCMCHGGNKQIEAQKRVSLRNYQLTKFKARVQRLGDSPDIKSLRDEVAILRMMLEERLNQCKDEGDLLMQSHTISDMVLKIERLVSSCNKLEGSMGQLMDKSAILQFANVVINIISDNIEDQVIINNIASRLMEAVGEIGRNSDAQT